ncbi:hypothetical protein HNP37_001647 [Flavobacterium nitrogenifigens]|uniref:Uncharacterized protein n=2 Tax=Flavobacterium TaxID=237 RepID=A0A7W7N7N8_9FLAO|nr:MULTISPECIES: hypothetical protein [Flavobacterium]MBB4801586.1 hypothetical protein [Flavobacterium nitrogenifigens]MBB6386544.1 hypothetical protein [Flavobacterium notoginsengisoli]
MDPYLVVQLVLISIGATSAMTWFSYFVSKKFLKLYKEPVLLCTVFTELEVDLSPGSKRKLGWLFHYLIGFLFVVGYHVVWVRNILSISLLSALILGIISGVIGIISWMFLFKITHYQTPIDYLGFYIQLFFAHIIFALVATLLYFITMLLVIITKEYIT